MQGDGNLVLYAEPGHLPIWASNTAGQPGAWAVMQGDGNLVVYTAASRAIWNSGTAGRPGAYTKLQSDGHLIVSSADDRNALWASNTWVPIGTNATKPNSRLTAGQQITSPDGNYRMIMQSDGNLVIYKGSTPTWSSNTPGNPGAQAAMQSDGNLVVYALPWRPVWASGTPGNTAAVLGLDNTGTATIYARGGRTLWTSSARGPGGCPAGQYFDLCARSVAQAPTVTAANAIKFAMNQIGHPYCKPSPKANGYGCNGDTNRFGEGPARGFDCSGLVYKAYIVAGIDIGATWTGSMIGLDGNGVATRHTSPVPGDLMVNHYNNGSQHVGMALADGKMIEASDFGVGVIISNQRSFQKYLGINAR
jgi:cell wall-associated NlpC family hydrolase